MAQTAEKKKIESIRKKTISDMTDLGVYRAEFDASIAAYAQMRYLYDLLMSRLEKSGYKVTEEYINNKEAVNIRKTADYQAIETLRKDILSHETLLGLNPAGLKKIRADTTTAKKQSKLEAALNALH